MRRTFLKEQNNPRREENVLEVGIILMVKKANGPLVI